MKKITITAYGAPEEVADCTAVPDVGDPGPDEVVFDVLAFPINPADVSFCRGSYRLRPPLPASPGAECVGRIAAVGGLIRSIAACTRSSPDGIGTASSALTRRRWTQFSRCMLMTRSPRLICVTPEPTAAIRPTHSAPGEAGRGGLSR